ncbi:MAG: Dabb family protein [Puniceicoccaceae bacterium]
MLVHSVFFYLKPHVTEAEKADFMQGLQSLQAIPTVRGFYVGTPAATPARPVIDSSYDAALTVLFDDVAGHDVYGPHAIHDAFISKYKHLWERVVVYDAD